MADIGIGELWKSEVLSTVLLAAGIGLVGGLARIARVYNDAITKSQVNTGMVVSSLILAGAAAIAALYVLTPESPLKFIAAAILAGYSGPALLDLLDNRMRLLVAETKIARATSVAERAVAAADQAVALAQTKVSDAAGLGAVPAAATSDVALADVKALISGLAQELDALQKH